MRMRDLLSFTPPGDQVRDASRRARLGALARLDEKPSLSRSAVITFACAMTAAILLLFAAREPKPATAPPPLQVNMTLTDGTRVVWTFDDNLAL